MPTMLTHFTKTPKWKANHSTNIKLIYLKYIVDQTQQIKEEKYKSIINKIQTVNFNMINLKNTNKIIQNPAPKRFIWLKENYNDGFR